MLSTLYRGLFFRLLEGMDTGSLEIWLPDGGKKTAGGKRPGLSAQIHVAREEFFKKCVLSADIGFGESYVDGDWDSPDPADVVGWFIQNIENSPAVSGSRKKSGGVNWMGLVNKALHKLRANSLTGSRRNISAHYDLGNDFFAQFLDAGMTYSCAYLTSPDQDLEEAQRAKYDALCQKLHIRAQDHVLEIGCGWGGFAMHAADTYGCKVTGITISREQFDYATQRVRQAGLQSLIDVQLTDYRRLEGHYDKIVSIEMIEAVGEKYLETFFAKCSQVLRRDGLLGIQYITCPDRRYPLLRDNVDWIQKHVFPGSLLLSVGRVNQALNKTGDLFLHHLEDMGHFYAATLSRWLGRFQENLEAVKKLGYNESFIRKWRYYLMYCMAAFKMRNISVVQAVYTRPNNGLLIAEKSV